MDKKIYIPRVGDMILYPYMGKDILKGRILKFVDKTHKKALIEIGVCKKKSEPVWTSEEIVSTSDLLPFDFYKPIETENHSDNDKYNIETNDDEKETEIC